MYGLSLVTDTLLQGIHFILHIDTHLTALAAHYGHWLYVILFLIVFCETGLVVAPFLPGDSLLFVAGALAASGYIDLHCLVALLCGAAILGDAVNYGVGHVVGQRLLQKSDSWWFRADYLAQAQCFYAKQGGKSLILARFIPILRTFAPFVAGIGRMTYRKFTVYNIMGALLWVLSFTYAGYYFGHLPLVKNNLHYLMGLIIILSVLPVLIKRFFFPQRSIIVDKQSSSQRSD